MNSKVFKEQISTIDLGLFLAAHSIIGQSVIEELESIKYQLSLVKKLSKQQKNQSNNVNLLLNQHTSKITKLYNNSFDTNEELSIQTGIDIENLLCYVLNNNEDINSQINVLFLETIDFKVPEKFVVTFTKSQRKPISQTELLIYYQYFLFKLFFEYNKHFKNTVWYSNLNNLNQLITYYNNICIDKQLISNINNIIKFIVVFDVNKLMLFYELIKLKLHVKSETPRK